MFEKIDWDERYSLNVKGIDKQHKRLFELVNEVYALDEHLSKEHIKELLYAFSDYMQTHFKDEEEYMRSIGFPDLAGHMKHHESIIESLQEIIKKPAALGIIKSKMKIVAKKVLVEHILKEDFKIKLYLESRGEVPPEALIDVTDAAFA